MLEYWLQKYIKEHYQQIGFTAIHGPYKVGADFKGVYGDKPVKIEAEWDYSDYVSHGHSLTFADVLVVASLKPVPAALKEKLPSIIITLDPAAVVEWAQPRSITKDREDYFAFPWRRFSRSLLDLYAYYRQQNGQTPDFEGSHLALSMNRSHTPPGFEFGSGGKETGFKGSPEDKAAWDYWLEVAHAVADHFKLKPALLRPTRIDRMALYFNATGRITEAELARFKETAEFIGELILK